MSGIVYSVPNWLVITGSYQTMWRWSTVRIASIDFFSIGPRKFCSKAGQPWVLAQLGHCEPGQGSLMMS